MKKILIYIFFILLCVSFYYNSDNKKIIFEDKTYLINNYNNSYNDKYLGILFIKKLNINYSLYKINSKYNSVSYGIEIIKSDMPDIDGGIFVLASHSGNSNIAYFNSLFKLKINDIITIYYNYKTYNYKVNNIYNVEKNGNIQVKRDGNTKIVLTTCDKFNKNKQFIVEGVLIK